jgi:hypothetical protein
MGAENELNSEEAAAADASTETTASTEQSDAETTTPSESTGLIGKPKNLFS